MKKPLINIFLFIIFLFFFLTQWFTENSWNNDVLIENSFSSGETIIDISENNSWDVFIVETLEPSIEKEKNLEPENIVALPVQVYPLLQIEEVYPKDSEKRWEYIMIRFFSSYSWDLRIVWLWTADAEKTFRLTASTGDTIVITDSVAKIQTGNYSIVTLSSITLTDTGEPLMIYTADGIQQDTILYSGWRSDSVNIFWWTTIDTRRFFWEYRLPSVQTAYQSTQWSNWTWTIVNSWSSIDLSWSCFIIVDTLYFSWINTVHVSLSSSWDTSICVQSTRRVNDITTPIQWCVYSWSLLPGVHTIHNGVCEKLTLYIPSHEQYCVFTWWQNTSGSSSTWSNSPVRIDEIHPRDTLLFPEYIELFFQQSFSGYLTIQWLWQWSASKTLWVSWVSWSRVIITDDPSKFSSTIAILQISSISLTDTTEKLAIYRSDWQMIDSVVYSWQHKNKALYVSGLSDTSDPLLRIFSSSDTPTPWFSRDIVAFLFSEEEKKTVVCGIDMQHSSPLYVNNKINLQAQIDYNPIANSNSLYRCEWMFSGTDIAYATGCNPSYIGYTSAGIFPLHLRIYQEEAILCEIHQEINVPIKVNSGPITSSSQEKPSYYEWLYKKRKERFEYVKQQLTSQGIKVTTSGDILVMNYDFTFPDELLTSWPNKAYTIRVHSILADPEWKDSLEERMVVENISEEVLVTDAILLQRWTTNKKLPSGVTLFPGVVTTIQWDLGLVNKAACIHLIDKTTKSRHASFCYPKPQQGVVYTGWIASIQTPEQENLLSSVAITLTDTESCVVYEDQSIVCKKLPFSLSEAKWRKKEAKKSLSLTKKVETLQWKYDLRRDKYTKQSQNHKKVVAGYVARNRSLRQQWDANKKQIRLYRSFYSVLRREITENIKGVRWLPRFNDIDLLYAQLAAHDEQEMLTVSAITMSPSEVESWHALYSDNLLPTDKVAIENVVEHFIPYRQAYDDLFTTMLQQHSEQPSEMIDPVYDF